MDENIVAVIVMYVLAAALTFALGAAKAKELWNSRWKDERARWARVALWSPLWPLILIVAGFRFMRDLISDLVRWSRGDK